MNKLIKNSILAVLFTISAVGLSYCQTIDIPQLVDNFKNATDLQRTRIINDNIGKEVTGTGKAANAEEYDLFDTANDVKGTFYRISTEVQKTADNTPYQIYFLFKDKNNAADVNKGQNIAKDGKIMQINDERLLISVWIYCAELSDTDKVLFKQSQTANAPQSLP